MSKLASLVAGRSRAYLGAGGNFLPICRLPTGTRIEKSFFDVATNRGIRSGGHFVGESTIRPGISQMSCPAAAANAQARRKGCGQSTCSRPRTAVSKPLVAVDASVALAWNLPNTAANLRCAADIREAQADNRPYHLCCSGFPGGGDPTHGHVGPGEGLD